MDFLPKMDKLWKPVKIHKKVKIAKHIKKIKLGKIFKALKYVYNGLFRRPRVPVQVPLQDNLAFMTCVIKVNPTNSGWHRAVCKVLNNCKGSRFKMDQNGVIEVSAIAEPDKLLKKLGRSKGVELHWFQFGQCSSNLFMPETKKKEPAAAAQCDQKPFPSYNINPYQNYDPRFNVGYPLPANRYGYHYPQLLPPPPPPYGYFGAHQH